MEKKTFYYARVSSKDQNLTRQIKEFISMGADERSIYCDKKTGADFNREQYQLLKNVILREGDTLIVKELDRLGRNKTEIKSELEYFKKHGIKLRVLDIPTTMMEVSDGQDWVWEMVNNVLIEVLGSIAEQERNKIKTRQREGIDAMEVVDGKKRSNRTNNDMGRPCVNVSEENQIIINKYLQGEISASECIRLTGLKKTSFYKLVKV